VRIALRQESTDRKNERGYEPGERRVDFGDQRVGISDRGPTPKSTHQVPAFVHTVQRPTMPRKKKVAMWLDPHQIKTLKAISDKTGIPQPK